MSYLLDTNAWVAYLNDRQSPVTLRLEQEDPKEIRFCSVVKAELCYGAYKSSRVQDNLGLLSRLFSRFESLPFDDAAAQTYGKIRSDLEIGGRRIGPHDLLIAAVALSRNLTLVTHNTAEFGRVPGLRVEDWELGGTPEKER